MNKIFGIYSNDLQNLNYNIDIFDNQKKISSYKYHLLTSDNEPFVKYDCQNKYIIIYNGFLTNKDELTCKLRTLGYQFKTDKDEEVIINSYIYYKEKCFNYLKGAYSIIIYGDNKLIIARDKIGIKPLFYSVYDNYIVFSNEIKYLLKSKLVDPIVDETGIKELLSIGPGFTPSYTPYKDIKMVKPGEYILYENDLLSKKVYYKLPIHRHEKSLEETKETLNELLKKYIKKVNNDSVSNTLLSGGIDSSIISYLTSLSKNINTYFLEINNNNEFISNDFQKELDKKYADIMVEHLNSNNKVIKVNEEELFLNLKNTLIARDYPGMCDIDSSLFVLFNNIDGKNLFTGEGADEIFGGYPWFYKKNYNSLIYPWIRNINIKQDLLNKNYKYLNLENHLLFSYNELLKDFDKGPDNDQEENYRKITYLNIYSFMQQLLYRQECIANINNLNIYAPFLDIDIIELAYNLPFSFKYNETEKYILKETYKNILPSKIINRIKNPYPKTYSSIYNKLIINKINEYLDDKNSTINKFFDKEKLLNFINNKELDVPFYGQLMSKIQFLAYLIQLEEWVQLYHIRFEI